MLAGGIYYHMRKRRTQRANANVAASEAIPMSNVAPKVAVPVTLKASDVEFSMGNDV